ncbi:MAG: MFS transporter [Candidatus Binatia bacterium]
MLQHRAIEALRYREFRLLWFGHSFSSMAFWMDQVSRGWLIYELTDSALQLGLVRGVQAIPTLFLSPVAGSTADRYSRKIQILVAQIVDGLMLGALAVLIFTGRIQPWHVYVTAFGMAVVQAFQQPARAAMIADTLPSSHLTNAIGLNSIIFNVARSTGPALAGVLIATFGTGVPMRLKRYFISWLRSGPCSFAPRSALPAALEVTRDKQPLSAAVSSMGGNSAGTTRQCAPLC